MARPNLLLICSDQLAQRAVGVYGSPAGATPSLDAFAARGTRMDQMYCNSPLCAPSRASFWTGQLPHQTGVVSNGRQWPCPEVPGDTPTVGSLFREAGYRTIHFGKRHDHGTLRGFDLAPIEHPPADGPGWLVLNHDSAMDANSTEQAVAFLHEHDPDAEGPFLATVDLQNPHNICGWIGANAGPEQRDIPEAMPLPPLPDNFEIHDITDRPRPIQYITTAHNRLSQAARWSEKTYRQYIAAYYGYVRIMDAQVGQILSVLQRRGLAENTLVVFFADHGEGMACHRMVTKHTSFYEETNRIPFILAGPGIDADGGHIDTALGSLIDLLPTLADYAGLDAPDGLPGISLLPYFRGGEPVQPHGYVVGQWHTEWGYTVEPGRMIRTNRYKYTRYIEGEGEELFDLQADPGETRTLIHDPAHAGVLQQHRDLLKRYTEETGDRFFALRWKADPRWRAHAPGYANHDGISAPAAAEQ